MRQMNLSIIRPIRLEVYTSANISTRLIFVDSSQVVLKASFRHLRQELQLTSDIFTNSLLNNPSTQFFFVRFLHAMLCHFVKSPSAQSKTVVEPPAQQWLKLNNSFDSHILQMLNPSSIHCRMAWHWQTII